MRDVFAFGLRQINSIRRLAQEDKDTYFLAVTITTKDFDDDGNPVTL